MHGQKRIQMNWTLINHFKSHEFDSPDEPGSGERMQESTVLMFDEAREHAGIAFDMSSGVRTPAHNLKVGGVEGSAHIEGWAGDVVAHSGTQKYKIVSALLFAGFNRIGISKTFIHADNDPTKPSAVIWTY